MDQGSANAILSILTFLLVAITGFYAWQTRRMVDEMKATRESQVQAVEEMRRAREAEIRPVLVPFAEATDIASHQMRWGVKNIGRGPALRVDVRLGYGGSWWHRLQSPVLMPGAVRYVRVPSDPQKDHIRYSDLQRNPLELAGSYFDIAGSEIRAEGQVPFIDEWTPLAHENLKRIVERDLGLPSADAPLPEA